MCFHLNLNALWAMVVDVYVLFKFCDAPAIDSLNEYMWSVVSL